MCIDTLSIFPFTAILFPQNSKFDSIMWDLFCCYVFFEDPRIEPPRREDRGTRNYGMTVVDQVTNDQLNYAEELKDYIKKLEDAAFKTGADVIESQRRLIEDLFRELEKSGRGASAPTMTALQQSYRSSNQSRQELLDFRQSLAQERPPNLHELSYISLSYS